MEIRIREDGAVVTESEFRAMNAESSLPVALTAEVLDGMGADPVLEGPQPTPTRYQYAQRDGVEEVDGQWFTKWIVVDMTDEQKDALDAQSKQANAATAKQMLEASDWADLASVRNTANTPHLSNTSAFDAYRVALRAIAIDPPVAVAEWPVRPDAIWV